MENIPEEKKTVAMSYAEALEREMEWRATKDQPIVSVFDRKKHVVVFLEDDPKEISGRVNKPDLWIYAVEEGSDRKALMVNSKPFAFALLKHYPLSGKVLSIQRTNKGEYDIKHLSTEDLEKLKGGSNASS